MGNKDVIIVDVRTPMEYERRTADGAINIPIVEIEDRLDEFKKMDKKIVTCCETGNRSGQAAELLKSLGIKNVHNGGSCYNVNINTNDED